MEPLVSVVVPSFNRGNLISQTILSVQNQSFKNWEMVIVDDGSKDNTREVVTFFLGDKRIKYVDRPKELPSGGNGARNYGLEICNGEFVKWLDSDDLLEPTCLEKQVKKIIEDDSDVVFCRSSYFTEEKGEARMEKPWHPVFPLESDNILRDFIIGKYRFSNNDGLWRKEILPPQPYDVYLKNSQEYLMIITTLAKTSKISFLPEFLVKVRRHNDQMPFKRNYASYAKNQCLSRYKAIKILKSSGHHEITLKFFLVKSMAYYILKQIKLREYTYLGKNLNLLLRSLTL